MKKKEALRERIIFIVIGIVIGIIGVLIFLPKKEAKLSNGEEIAIKVGNFNITANDIYNDLKSKYITSSIFTIVDKTY